MTHRCVLGALALALVACGASDGSSPIPASGTHVIPGDGASGDDAGAVVGDSGILQGDDAGSRPPPAPGDDGGAGIDGSGGGGAGGPRTEVAPYFYTWGWGSNSYAFGSLAQMKQMGGPSQVTIAFVLSNNGGCAPTTDVQDNLDDVKAYVAAGGALKASFGGADGTYLESACSDAPSLAKAIETFIDATGITDLDFDVEQGASTSNPGINKRRGAALAQVQKDRAGVRVAFTLPVNPDGLDDLGKAVVQGALDAGVAISFVNVMTMDYGDSFANQDLGQVAIGSADATAKQLVAMMPGLALADAYARVGVTPMIGHNDDAEVFTLADAQAVAAWARQKHLGLLAFWAIQPTKRAPARRRSTRAAR